MAIHVEYNRHVGLLEGRNDAFTNHSGTKLDLKPDFS